MAATAQDSTAPLRGEGKKDEDREDESESWGRQFPGDSAVLCGPDC